MSENEIRVRLAPDLRDWLDSECKRLTLNRSVVVRAAIQDWLSARMVTGDGSGVACPPFDATVERVGAASVPVPEEDERARS